MRKPHSRRDRVSASLLLNSGNEGSRNSPADIRMFVVITPGVVHCDGWVTTRLWCHSHFNLKQLLQGVYTEVETNEILPASFPVTSSWMTHLYPTIFLEFLLPVHLSTPLDVCLPFRKDWVWVRGHCHCSWDGNLSTVRLQQVSERACLTALASSDNSEEEGFTGRLEGPASPEEGALSNITRTVLRIYAPPSPRLFPWFCQRANVRAEWDSTCDSIKGRRVSPFVCLNSSRGSQPAGLSVGFLVGPLFPATIM